MDLRNLLKVNQRVYIEFLDRKGETRRYPSRVEDISESRIKLASPFQDRIPIFIPSGDFVSVIFLDRLSVYSFESKVVVSLPEHLPVLIIEHPETIKKVQKREFVRVAINLNCLLSFESSEGTTQEVWCKSRDLSGGGMMLALEKSINIMQGAKVKVAFKLDDEALELKGDIARVYEDLDASGIKRQIIGVKFNDLAERERQIIIKSVYQRQIELRRKGLL